MFLRPTIGFKLIASVSLMVISLAVILSSFFVHNQKLIIENELRNQGLSLSKNLAYNSEYGLLFKNKEMLDRLSRDMIKNNDIAYAAICDLNGKIISYSANSTLWIDFPRAIKTSHASVNQYSYKGKGVYDIATPVYTIKDVHKGEGLIFDSKDNNISQTKQEDIGFVRIGILLENKEKAVKTMQIIAFFISFLVISGGILWTVLLTRRITIPIKQLVRMTTMVAAGDYSCYYVNGKTRRDEIGDLTTAFNTMTKELAASAMQIEDYTKNLKNMVEVRTSELKDANERLKKLDELKTNFLSIATHEIRTPLASISAFCELLINNPDEDVNVKNEFLGIIQQEIERLTRLINDILDLSKIEAGKTTWHIEDVSMINVVKAAIESMKGYVAQQGILLEVDVPAHLPNIAADHDKLIQVVVNLLNNALKFTHKCGRIGVRIWETTPLPEVLPLPEGLPPPAGLPLRAEVITAIFNTGHGIPAEQLDRVFEKFCQVGNIPTKTKGTGLGLTICKEIIEHLGGRIWVESEIDDKTTFFFSLPVK
ncbi:MAG: ATP-binding protein [bacterium]|nr:ATP-binding protein [bacterium]